MTDKEVGVIGDPPRLTSVGHRVVHGGERFAKTMVLTAEVKEGIKIISACPLTQSSKLPGHRSSRKDLYEGHTGGCV